MCKSAPSLFGTLAFRQKATTPGKFKEPQTTSQRVQKSVVDKDEARNALKREVEHASAAAVEVKPTADVHTVFSRDLRGALESVADVNRKLDPTTTTNEVIHKIFELKLSNSLRRRQTTQKPSQDAVDLARRRRAARMPIRKRHTKGQLRLPFSSDTIHSDSLMPDPGYKHTMIPNPSYRPPIHTNLPTYLVTPMPAHILIEQPISPPPETGKFVKIHYRRATTNFTANAVPNATDNITSDYGHSASISNGSFTWDPSVVARAADAARTISPESDLTEPWKLDLAHLPQSYEKFKAVATSRVWHGVLGKPVSSYFEIWRARGVWRKGELKGWDCVGEMPFSSLNGNGAEGGDETIVWRGFSVSEVYKLFCEEVQGVMLDLEEKSKWSGWHGKAGWNDWVAFSSQDVVGRVVVGFEEV